ncbi:MAG: bifunctional diaminohydroxyphosphoribosylaminopyrimidine deaminase/5-amino-6-(5-phosphoribosylamino)uracil reductase RibD [Bacteroidia bacterium]
MVKFDRAYLNRCLHLASLAGPAHFPNPQVGAVIVHNGRIIGEGYHQQYGGPHAEVNAVQSVADKTLLKQSTIYVSLEPCNHTGKTPPCVDLILTHKIPRVVVGCTDPNPAVAGKGIARLREHGVEVVLNPDPAPFEALIAWFRVNQLEKRSYMSLKWAESANGFIGDFDEAGIPRPVQLTGFEAGIITHHLRANHQAILIGRQTAMSDQPRLDTRLVPGHSPMRLILDPQRSISDDDPVLGGGKNTVRLCKHPRTAFDHPIPEDARWEVLLPYLYTSLGICSILVEGGSNTLQRILDEGLADAITRYISPGHLQSGTRAPAIPHQFRVKQRYLAGKDVVELLN